MVKQNKRKSGEGVVAATGAGAPKTPKKEAATPKKVKIQAESPKQLKNKPMKTPIKHKAPKSPAAGNKKSPVKKGKKGAANGTAKPKQPTKPKIKLLPDDLTKKLNRRQKKRMAQKIARALKSQGTEDLANIDHNSTAVKEIYEKIIKDGAEPKEVKVQKNKSKVLKRLAAEAEAAGDDEEADKPKTPKKKPAQKKSPKKSPKAK